MGPRPISIYVPCNTKVCLFFLYWHQIHWLKLFDNCFELETRFSILVTWFYIVNEGGKITFLPYLMFRLSKLKLNFFFIYNECCWCKWCLSLMSISRRLGHYKSTEVFEIDVSLNFSPWIQEYVWIYRTKSQVYWSKLNDK